jgi:hypothetical protein
MEWLSHGYGNGRVVDIWAVDAYSGMELCTPILLGEAMWIVFGSSRNMYVVEEPFYFHSTPINIIIKA